MRWLKPAVAALAALVLVGCVELDPKARPADPPPPADARRGDLRPPTSRALEHVPPPDDADPAVTAAELDAGRVAALEERIDAALTAVAEDVRGLSGADGWVADGPAEQLLAAVRPLRRAGERVVERYPAVRADLAAVGKATARVRVAYRRVRELYIEKADLDDGDQRAQYLVLADLSEALARRAERRAADYAAFAGDLERAMERVERHVAFLKDFEAFLRLDPSPRGTRERREFVASLNAFAEQVLKFGEVLRLFRDRARDGAVSHRLQAEHDRVTAARLPRAGASVVEERTAQWAVDPPPQPARPRPAAPPAPPVAPPAIEVAACPPAPAAPAPPAPRLVPVTVTRCAPTLVPVTRLTAYRDPCGRCRTAAVTRYEWHSQLVRETRYVAAP